MTRSPAEQTDDHAQEFRLYDVALRRAGDLPEHRLRLWAIGPALGHREKSVVPASGGLAKHIDDPAKELRLDDVALRRAGDVSHDGL